MEQKMSHTLGRLKDFDQDDFFDLMLPHEAEVSRTQRRESKVRADIPPDFKFNMYWMGKLCGRLAFDDSKGFWEFQGPSALDEAQKRLFSDEMLAAHRKLEKEEEDHILKRLTECKAGLEGTRVPYFVESLMPESWISNSGPDEVFDVECADRYLSNIVIRPNTRKTPIRVDVRAGSLSDPGMIDESHVFQGRFDDIFIPSEDEKSNLRLNKFYEFKNYAALHASVDAPRMSGVQDKLPAYLSREGVLGDATDNSFTHILKFPVSKNNIKRGLCSVEWFSTLLARRCGLETENFAVSEIPGFGPVFIAERFDIRENSEDRRAILAEDFCSILGVRRIGKDQGDLYAILYAIELHSTSPQEDMRLLMKTAMFAWLIENDDMHMKNMMLVKTYDENMQNKLSVRLSPVYDMLCTSIYTLTTEPALSAMDSREYSLDLFRNIAEEFDIKGEEINAMAHDLIEGILEQSRAMMNDLPNFILNHTPSLSDIEDMLNRITGDESRLTKTIQALQTARRPRPA